MDILIADDQAEIRSALRLLLAERDGVWVTAEATDAASLAGLVRAYSPEAVLLDWELGGTERTGAALVAELNREFPGVAVVALSARPEVRAEALHAGASEFVCKGNPAEFLLAALRRLRLGTQVND